MKRLLPFLILLFAASAYATPSKAKWVRQIYLGADNDYFYALRIERDYPGSHYQWRQSDYLTSSTLENDNIVTRKTLLRTVEHRVKDIDAREMQWERIDHAAPGTPDVQQFMLERGIDYDFPRHTLYDRISPIDGFVISGDGLMLVKEDARTILLPMDELKKKLEQPTFGYYEGAIHAGPHFIFQDYYLIQIQYGMPSGEIDFIESFVAIPKEAVEEALKQ